MSVSLLAVLAILAASPSKVPEPSASLSAYQVGCALGDENTHGVFNDDLPWPQLLGQRRENLAMDNYGQYSVEEGDAGVRSARCNDLYPVLDSQILVPNSRKTRGCKRLFIQCGTFDLEAGRTASDIQGSINALIARAKVVYGMNVVLLTVPPLMGASWYSPSIQAEHMALNASIQSTPGVVVVDIYSALATLGPVPVTPYPGDYLGIEASWRWQPTDYVHLGPAGHVRMADAVDFTPGALP